jgi:hypothetical protein
MKGEGFRMIYAGIGSRETPEATLAIMYELGRKLAKAGWTLRTGGAPGADTAFLNGCNSVAGKFELYLPWKGFEGHTEALSYEPKPPAFEIAKQYHPGWQYLKPGAQRLHARNSYQVLGLDLDHPADLIICWTPGGKHKGGTAQALRIAEAYNVRIANLGEDLTGKLFSAIILGV